MRHYCTYFDSNYLSRGLALHDSLRACAGEFQLTVLCMDDAAEAALRTRALPGVQLLPVARLVEKYPALAAARSGRSKLEFYFTCTSWLMRHLLPQLPAGELLTYLDADLYFFASPQAVYDEIGPASVAITPHRFPPSLVHLERYGRFNVGWVSFRHDPTGLACAADWADQCAAWCFNQLEPERYADQKYLDAWEVRFPGTVSLSHPGVNAAPWNIKDCVLTAGPAINGRPLIFYHFHALVHLGRQLYDASLHKYDATLSAGLREHVYLPYLRQLLNHGPSAAEAPDLVPPAAPADPRVGLALAHLWQLVQASELDRAQRLAGIDVISNDRDLARADLDRTIAFYRDDAERKDAFLRAELARRDAHLTEIQQDSAARLEALHFHQEKLKTAYADLERNVAYLKTLEAEIAAHIKVGADKDAIIADLSARLRAATERPPAGP
jgi:hypothetical protein